jgi:hypothetical protein
LLNHARANGKPFAEVLLYYAMERFLYRLPVSPHTDKFLLKGAFVSDRLTAPYSRPTMDIGLLGPTDNAIEAIVGDDTSVPRWLKIRPWERKSI